MKDGIQGLLESAKDQHSVLEVLCFLNHPKHDTK